MLTPNQYGFRQYRSTTDVLINIETSIREAFLNNENLIKLCLDIEKAYDTIQRTKIINTLIWVGIREHMLAFIKKTSLKRYIQIRINGHLSQP